MGTVRAPVTARKARACSARLDRWQRMTFTKDQIEAVRRAYPDDWDAVGDGLDECSRAHDALNDAPVVETHFAWGANDTYRVVVRGVPGAYFVSAIDFDEIGVFSTVDEARAARRDFWCMAGVFETDEDAWAFAKSNGWI